MNSKGLSSILILSNLFCCQSLTLPDGNSHTQASRRDALGWFLGSAAAATALAEPSWAITDVEDYLKTGMVSMPMGVSGQAGKSKPETGVIFRDGSDVARDPRNGDVSAEILVKPTTSTSNDDWIAVLTSFSSPWPLAKGSVFDVECRDAKSGDGAFLTVSSNIGGKQLSELSNSFFIDELFSPTGRFSFYGQPTDIKISKTKDIIPVNDNTRILDLSFSALSQSTQTEIPRRAKVVAVLPEGSSQVVMLVASASANRWKKGSEKQIASTVESFRAIPAPPSSLKIRAKMDRPEMRDT